MNTILKHFLSLKEILNSFNGLEKDYNWLLTDLEWSENHLEYFQDYRIFDDNDDRLNNFWITGENLTKLANQEDVYFIWGVFSAFKMNESLDLDSIQVEPYADGNPKFWVDNPEIQHPKAVAELILWDSSLILLLSKDTNITSNFRRTFKDWKDLNIYNQS